MGGMVTGSGKRLQLVGQKGRGGSAVAAGCMLRALIQKCLSRFRTRIWAHSENFEGLRAKPWEERGVGWLRLSLSES